jgi:hypothetical protein
VRFGGIDVVIGVAFLGGVGYCFGKVSKVYRRDYYIADES